MSLSLKMGIGFLVGALLGAGIMVVSRTNETPLAEEQARIREVRVAQVHVLGASALPLAVSAEVRSASDIEVKAEKPGIIRSVGAVRGERVGAGQVLAVIDNATERAQVAQARAAVEAAVAQLARTTSGAREEDVAIIAARRAKEERSLAEARTGLQTAFDDAFAKADDAIRNRIDLFFIEPTAQFPQLRFHPEPQLEIDLERERFLITLAFEEWEAAFAEGTDTALTEKTNQALSLIESFLDTTAEAVNGLSAGAELSQQTVDLWRASVVIARTNVLAAMSGISGARERLNSAELAFSIAQEEEARVMRGARDEDIASTEAALRQAEAQLASAQALLAKTIITAPAAGTLITFDLVSGRFVSLFETVGVVVNENATELIAFVSNDERADLSVGSPVVVAGGLSGTLSSIAPALDRTTGKVEVRITLVDTATAASFLNGERVTALLTRTPQALTEEQSISLPLTALRIRGSDTFVFVVENETLVARPVQRGHVRGEEIAVVGLAPDDAVVLDARGLSEGEPVRIVTTP